MSITPTRSAFSLMDMNIAIDGHQTIHGERATHVLRQLGANILPLAENVESMRDAGTIFDGVLFCAQAMPPASTKLPANIDGAIARLTRPALLALHLLHHGQVRDGASIVFEKNHTSHPLAATGSHGVNLDGGLDTLTSGLALEYSTMRIRVNMITTSQWGNTSAETFAHAAAYLLAPASRWVTGSNLVTANGGGR